MMLRFGDKQSYKIYFQYERLGNFCYACGALDHLLRECDEFNEDGREESEDAMKFGPWLRALNF